MVQIVTIVGPSCVGKTSVLEQLQKLDRPWSYPLSTTTRASRPEEEVGGYYHFLSHEDFNIGLANGDFIEHAIVHEIQYGLQRADIECCWEQGIEKSILIVDIQGVRAIKELYSNVLSIFLLPGNFSDLKERLQARNLSEEEMVLRLSNAEIEINEHRRECDWQVLNIKGELTNTVNYIINILEGE